MTTPTYPPAIKTRQRFLKSRGFDPGPIDGEWGQWTQKAEDAFQESIKDVANVRSLQTFLNERGATLRVDGIYGPATREAELTWDKGYPGHPEHEGQNLARDGFKPVIAESTKGDLRTRIIQVAKSLVGTREKTGHNDGVVIDDILAACGLRGTKNPYCACFVVYCGDMAAGKANNPYPRSAWSPDMVAKPTWQQGIGGKKPQPGDTFGIYFASQGRVAHTGIIAEWPDNQPYCLTYEGNTGASGSVGEKDRNGDGVYYKRRMKSDIHAVRDWIG